MELLLAIFLQTCWLHKTVCVPGCVRRQLSDMFQLTIVTQRKHIHSIAHSFGYLDKIQVCDLTITPMTSQNIYSVKHQLLDTNTNCNYQIAVYFCSTNYRIVPKFYGTVSYTLNISFEYFCRMYMKLRMSSNFKSSKFGAWYYLSLSWSYYDTGMHLCLPVL